MNKRHFWLLVLLILALPMIAAIFQNTYTTQNPGKTPANLLSDPGAVNPIVHKAGDGTVLVDTELTLTGTNANLTGNMTNNLTRSTNGIYPLDVGASKLMRTDSNTKAAAVTVG